MLHQKFSLKAKQMIEGRLIDLVEGKKLTQILKKLTYPNTHKNTTLNIS